MIISRPAFQFLIINTLLLFNSLYGQQAFQIIKAERPKIDLELVPESAFELHRIIIKISEAYASKLPEQHEITQKNGIVDLGIEQIGSLNKRFHVKSAKQYFYSQALGGSFTARHKAWGFDRWYEIEFEANRSDLKTIISEYKKLNSVEFAEPIFKKRMILPIGEPDSVENKNGSGKVRNADWNPNDPQFVDQWNYHNTGQQAGTIDKDIDLPEAWETETGNADIIVAIIDGGIQIDHPDLAGNIWSGIGYNFVNNNTTIIPHNHGTHVAGIVSAVNNNNIGVAGIAGGSGLDDGVRLMSCQVFTDNAAGGFHIAPIYAADNGASISQNSWGYIEVGVYEQAVLDAIDYFNANGGGMAMNGGLTIFAAGNDNSPGLWYPGCYSGSLSVAATNIHDVRSYYSNYDTWVDISAPGGETSPISTKGILSTLRGSTYGFYQGTSMACPHVSGVAALILSIGYGQLDNNEVWDILINSADDHYELNPSYIGQLGSGRLNAKEALDLTQSYLSSIQNPQLFQATALSAGQIQLNWIKNQQNDNVMVVWSPTSAFGVPSLGENYSIGQSLAGGGTVLYKGSDESTNHSGLNAGTIYYFKAYSFNEIYQYSAGKTAQAQTMCSNLEPILETPVSPVSAGLVTVYGSTVLGATIQLTASPFEGWTFTNWTDHNDSIISTAEVIEITLNQCSLFLQANFSPTNSLIGKLTFFNPQESEVISPYPGGSFVVQLFDNELPVSEPISISQGIPFVFDNLQISKQYTIRLWDQPLDNLIESSWTWNNWGGVSALDALIVNYMATENPAIQNFPWIATPLEPMISDFAFNIADVNSSNSLTALDALLLMYRSVGFPGVSPFPGGNHNFPATASYTNDLNLPTYPEKPEIIFSHHGEYFVGQQANSIYQQAKLLPLEPGQNFLKIFLSAAGDVNASYSPVEAK